MPRRSPSKPVRSSPVSMNGPVSHRPTAELILLAAGVILLGFFCFSIYPVLSPFVLLGGLIFLLFPYRHEPVARRLMHLGVLLFVVWFLTSILSVLVPFIIAFLLAYILNPLVVRLEGRRFPRWASALSVLVLVIGAIIVAGIFVVPVAVDQLQSILGRAGMLADEASRSIGSGTAFDFLGKFGVTGEKAREALVQSITPRLEEMLKRLFEALFGILVGVTSVAHQLLNIIIIPFVLFYLLMDFPIITHRCAMLVPKRSRERFVALAGRADTLMGRYFRGAIVVALIQGTISAFVLWLIGVDYAIVLGIMTAMLNFVPYVGLAVSLVVAAIVAFFSGGAVMTKVGLVVIMYLAQKLLEATVLGPKILGTQVGLHPVLLILCLLVFGYFLGFVGLLVAVPATALIIAGVKEWEAVRKQGIAQRR